jgi:Uma2 family endonuclease
MSTSPYLGDLDDVARLLFGFDIRRRLGEIRYNIAMTAAPWPDHLLTLDEWENLPDSFRHYELVKGLLVKEPRPAPLHQRATRRLADQLDSQLPDELTALPEVEVIVNARHPRTIRVPDVVVTTDKRAQENPPRLDAADVLLAVEIVSPGSGRTDRVTKLDEYANAGIPHYWIVDLDEPATLTAYILVDRDYEIIERVTYTASLSEPAAITIDMRTLTNRR